MKHGTVWIPNISWEAVLSLRDSRLCRANNTSSARTQSTIIFDFIEVSSISEPINLHRHDHITMKFNIPTIVGALAAMSNTVESLSLRGLLGREGDASGERTAIDGDAAKYAEERILANLAAPSAFAEDDKNEDGDRRGLQWIADCATVAYWHPKYTAGWSSGYCELSTGCNAPSFLNNLDCCNQAYIGQSPTTCLNTAGIAPPTPPAPTPGSPPAPTPGGTVWYPDYNAQWGVGKCINAVPLPPYGSRPLYITQLECCKAAYAGQTSGYCIQNLANPPTSKPTSPPTDKPTTGPTTDKPTGVPTTSMPTSNPTDKPTGVPTTNKPTGGPSVIPTRSPTAVPTTGAPTVTQYGAVWYPKYDFGYCSNKLPLPVNGAAPYFGSKQECCSGTYSTWSSTKVTACMNLGP